MKHRFVFFSLLIALCARAQSRYDIVIAEIMADPLPVVGLPNYEWIELKNTSPVAHNLQGWRVADGSGQSGPLPAFILGPDSSVVICSSGALAYLSAFGTAIAVTSFPSLDNDEDVLSLRSSSGVTIHAVRYETAWMQNAVKQQGGWSLEMIDPRKPCTGHQNWKASEHPAGGTPGRMNSVNGNVPDTEPPLLVRSYTTDPVSIRLVFSEPVDSFSAAQVQKYALTGFSIAGVNVIRPLFEEVEVKLNTALLPEVIYEITADGISDCAGNTLALSRIQTGLASIPLPRDCIINEILFDPRPGGSDYVEIVNNSKKIIDLNSLYLANRSLSGSVADLSLLSADPRLLFPGQYIVVTENARDLALQYHVKEPSAVIEVPSLPSYPDESGTVVLTDSHGILLDEVAYDEKWHFPLIAEPEGVSLERLNPSGVSQDPRNWHSAASTSGYGTPGYQNSQAYSDSQEGALSLSTRIFSPDNDGRDDFVFISYEMPNPGSMVSVTIFNLSGNAVRYLVRNELAGLKGEWRWDGLNEKGLNLPVGIYVVLAEFYDLQGRRKSFKLPVVLAGNF